MVSAAAAYAMALAAQMGADLCILTVLNVSGVYAIPDVMASSELLMESVEQQGQEMLAHTAARAIHAGVPHVALLKWGNVAETILQTVAEEQCDLIVLGSRGLSASGPAYAREYFECGGSQSPMSVLVIKQPPLAPLHWRRVLVATGGSPWSEAAVDRAIELARVQQLEVCLLYVEQRRSRRIDSLFSLTSDGKNVLALAEARAVAS